MLFAGLLGPGLAGAQGGPGGNGADYYGVGGAGGASSELGPGGAGTAGPDGGLSGGGGGGAGVTGGAGAAGSARGGPAAAGGRGGATPGAAGEAGEDATSNFGSGGGGGGGAHGWVGLGLPSGSVTGGAGGAGGSVPFQIIGGPQGGGGGGGAGGFGAVVTGSGDLGTLTGSVTGGAGGAGGFASPGGGTGAGGAGLVFTQSGVTARLDGDVSGAAGSGRGGAGIVGSAVNLTINGRVSGGLGSGSPFAANSFVLGEGTSRLTFGTQAQVVGAISISGALEFIVPEGRLSLGGLGDGGISGAGSVRIRQGVVEFRDGNSYTGGTTIDSPGTLIIGAGGFAGRNAAPLGGGNSNLPGDVVNNGRLVFQTYRTHVHSGVISGTGTVEFNAASNFFITGANTYSGNTIINGRGSSVILEDAGTLGDGTGRVTVNWAGTLDISQAGTAAGRRINSLEGAGTVRLGAESLTLGAAGGNSVFSGRITDTTNFGGPPRFVGGGLTIAAGRTILTGSNDYSGTTRINAGATLQIGDGGTTGTLGTGALNTPATQAGLTSWPGPGPVINNGTLAFNRADSVTVANAISGSGSLVHGGTGNLILTAENTYSGATQINTGATLQIGNGGTSGTLGTGTPSGDSAGLRSPGPVINNGTLAFNRADSVTVANVISGSGSLVQNGPGNLILTAENTYTGVTRITGGTLSVNGSIASSSAVILEGGILGGTGTLSSLVVPAGSALSPGNSIGTIRVAGDLTLAAGSTTTIEVLGDTSDRVQVSGAARLGGTLQLVPLGGRYSFATPYTIIQAATVTGQFGEISTTGSFGVGVVAEVSTTPTEVRLTLAPNLLAQAVAGGPAGLARLFGQNVLATASAIDSAGRAGGNLSPFFNVFNQPAGSIGAAINQLSGEVATASTAMGQMAGAQFLATVLDPLGWGREAILGGRLRLGDDPRQGQRHAVWGTATGVYNRTSGDATDGSAARTTRTSGFVLGLDLLQGAQSLAGVAVAVGESSANLSNGQGNSRGSYGQIGAYGSTRLGSITLAAAGAFTFLDVDTRRMIYVLGNDRQTGGGGVQVYSLRAEARQDGVAAFGLRVLPVAALQLQLLNNQGYTEQSVTTGSAHGLTVAARTNTSMRSELGGQLQGETLWGGRRVQGFARASWAHYLQRDASMDMAFTSLPASGFTVRGARPDTNAALVSLGLETELMAGVTLGARLDSEWSGNLRQVAGTARLRYLF